MIGKGTRLLVTLLFTGAGVGWIASERGRSRTPELSIGNLQSYSDTNSPYDGKYHFFRVQYDVGRGSSGFSRRREPAWAHDYPRAERNFLNIIQETTFVDSQTEGSNILRLNDPEIFKYPIAYIVEVGSWNPTEEEVAGLGAYL